MFENKLVKNIHKSRYVASWVNAGGAFGHYSKKTGRFISDGGDEFQKWLGTLIIDGEHLTDEEILDICTYATNGKFELQNSARDFLKE